MYLMIIYTFDDDYSVPGIIKTIKVQVIILGQREILIALAQNFNCK